MKKVYKIMIVEDEALLQKTLKAKIKRQGWQAIVAGDGQEGLAKFEKDRPDLILLDLRLPTMSGFEMLEIVRKKYNKKELPVIILTNYSEGENVSRALELGADVFLVKANYSLDEIVEKIEEILK